MQTLFAYEQCREANITLAQDLIEQRFTPDLNSMEVQDKTLLKKQAKEGARLYHQLSESGESISSDDKAVTDIVAEAYKYGKELGEKDFSFLKRNLVVEVEKINFWYHSVLGLLLAFVDVCKADKKVDHSNFVKNVFLLVLEKDPVVQSLLTKTNAAWENEKSLVQSWFRDVIKPDKTYTSYVNETSPDETSQRNIIKHIVRKLILGETVINDYFSERNIRWAEDHDIVKSLVDKTFKSINPESQAVQLQKLSMDWDDDLVFMNTLFEKTTKIEKSNKELIARNTKNWEVDRLPLTDRVILEMAITELINFPAIPVKVSINEYIELTKHYSTPKSAKFVNGILDVIAKELLVTGVVKKSGRGLIDNK